MNIVKIVKKHAEEQQLTVDELLRRAKIDDSMWSRWRRGKSLPTLRSINKVLQVRNRSKKNAAPIADAAE